MTRRLTVSMTDYTVERIDKTNPGKSKSEWVEELIRRGMKELGLKCSSAKVSALKA